MPVPFIEVGEDIEPEKIVVSTWEQTRERRCDGLDADSERTREALRPEYDHVLAECPGTDGQTALPGVSIDPELRGWLGLVPLPPGGVSGRDPAAVGEAATVWRYSRS